MTNTTGDWTEVGGGDSDQEMWNREGTVIGTYTNKQTEVGPNKSNIYTLTKEDGETIGIWGSTVLDTKFEKIPLNSQVKITSLGKVTGKRGNSYNDYQVFVKPPKQDSVAKGAEKAFPGAEVAE